MSEKMSVADARAHVRSLVYEARERMDSDVPVRLFPDDVDAIDEMLAWNESVEAENTMLRNEKAAIEALLNEAAGAERAASEPGELIHRARERAKSRHVPHFDSILMEELADALEAAEREVERLRDFVMNELPGKPSDREAKEINESPVDSAIQWMREQVAEGDRQHQRHMAALDQLRVAMGLPARAALSSSGQEEK